MMTVYGGAVERIANAASDSVESDEWDADHFARWMVELRAEAIDKGITPFTFDEATRGLHPLSEVLEKDRRQPEFTLTLDRYLSRAYRAPWRLPA